MNKDKFLFLLAFLGALGIGFFAGRIDYEMGNYNNKEQLKILFTRRFYYPNIIPEDLQQGKPAIVVGTTDLGYCLSIDNKYLLDQVLK